MKFFAALVAALVACDSHSSPVTPPTTVLAPSPAVPAWLVPYQVDVARIIASANGNHAAYQKLAYLTDRIGHRLSGSPQLEKAVDWAANTMRLDGHDVHTEPVMVPHWQRGAESAELLSPTATPLHILGLGGTVATPPGGLSADVIVVKDWQELEVLGAAGQVRGKIVLVNAAMPAWSEAHGTGYNDVVGYRWRAARTAAPLGAVAVLVRSVTAHSLNTPHTGSMGYQDGVEKIPAAAISVEDAELIARLAADQQPVRVRLVLSGITLAEAPSANVIGELRGRELPDEVVLIGAHLDSWDVGQGAHDDGAGCVIMMQALTTLRQLGLTPRRTIRVVLFTNEENGLRGARDYAATHESEHAKHVLALEADMGGFDPRGFDLEVPEAPDGVTTWSPPFDVALVESRLRSIAALLVPLGAARVQRGHAGADVGPLIERGVVGVGLSVDESHYFDLHHSAADTLDKVSADALAKNAAAVAALAYVVADAPARIDASAVEWDGP